MPNPAGAPPFRALRIVAIGGGTGLSAVLQGLKYHAQPQGQTAPAARMGSGPTADITAVVTVTDDGGSSGRLRRDFKVLPPGDIRNCMVALSETESLLSRLFQHRFVSGSGLEGHSFGNLFLTALTQITGDFPQAVKLSSEVLAIAGRIYPSTNANVVLEATLANGRTVVGETRITRSRSRIVDVALIPRHCRPLPETLEAIARADLIALGPGSLFTSIVPNLLVQGIPHAIRNSHAVKACFINLMCQPGETTEFTASDHIRAIYKHAGVRFLDYAIVNTGTVSDSLRRKYARRKAVPVKADPAALRELGLAVIGRDLARESETVRHDSYATATVALELAEEGRRRRERYEQALCAV